MYVHVCNITTRNSSGYVHEQHVGHSGNDVELKKFKDGIILYGATHAQGNGGSIHMSRHRVLLKIVDHSQYRKMITVQSLERPPENRRDDPRKKKTTSSITRKKL